MGRHRRPRLRLLCAFLGAACALVASQPTIAAGPIDVACSPDAPTIDLDGGVLLSAWVSSSSRESLRYVWDAPVGRLESRGHQARWELGGLRPGVYAAAVRVSAAAGASEECVMRVVVRQDSGSRGPGPTPARETGSALLVPAGRETEGYGLYSYLLLGAPPAGSARERSLKAIDAFWSVLPGITALEQYVPRAELNIAYVPVTGAPRGTASAEWIVDNYDYARARSLLRLLGGAHRDGPYLLSTLKPLGSAGPATPERFLFQDLSNVPPQLAASWVKEFLNQAAQQRFWDERTGATMALKLRVTVAVLGEGLPEVKKALDTWISWGR